MSGASVGEQLEQHRGRFPGPSLEMVMASICAGNTGGRLWKIPNDGLEPLLLLWDQGNCVFYFSGDVVDGLAVARLQETIAAEVVPEARAEGVSWFKVRALSDAVERRLPDLFAGITLRASPYLFYRHDRERQCVAAASSLSDSYEIVPITADALAPGRYTGNEEVREEIRGMWPSLARFQERGFGRLAVKDGAIACWCTAEYVGPRECGIGIATRSDLQRRGIATATAISFIREAYARGLTPCWECRHSNLPSCRVAEKAGFVLAESPQYWIGSLL